MTFDKGKTATLLITLGALLIFISILVQTGSTRIQGPRRLNPRDKAHWFGWMGTILLAASSAYPVLKRSAPMRLRRWLDIHCALGLVSLPLILVHFYHRLSLIRPVHMASVYTFGLMILIISSGFVRRLIPMNRFVREYWLALHVPLSVAFYITLVYHAMQKMVVV